MFAWGIHVIESGSTLLLNVPMHWAFLLMCSLPLIFLRLLPSGTVLRNVLIGTAVILAYGFMMSSTQLFLDRAAQTATVRRFVFFHWSSQQYPLQEVNGVVLHTGSTTSRMDLQFSDGSIRPLTWQDQSGGKEKAVLEINSFLAGHSSRQQKERFPWKGEAAYAARYWLQAVRGGPVHDR